MVNRGNKPTPIIEKALNTERRAEVWELKVRKGASVIAIAKELGISPSTVYTHLRAIMKEAEATLDEDVFRWKMEQHYKYDHLYAESMAAWERSKRDMRRDKIKREPTRKDTDIAKVPPSEIVTTTEAQAGDSRFLASAISALQAQAKLWGFNAPDMIETTSRSLSVTATVTPENAGNAVRAAERAFREAKYGQRTVPALPELTGIVVPGVRDDHPSDEGENPL